MMILRHPLAISRSSQAIFLSASRRTASISRFACQNNRVSLIGSRRAYATEKLPKEPKKNNSNRKDTSKITKKEDAITKEKAIPSGDGQPAQPAPGSEHLYKSSPLSKPLEGEQQQQQQQPQPTPQPTPPPEENKLEDGFVKLTPDQERMFDERALKIIGSLPKSLAPEVEKAFADVKKHGIPPELHELLTDLQNGKPLSLASSARLIRVTGEMARKSVERSMKSEQTDKKDGPSSTFFSQDKEDEKKKNKNKSNSDQEKQEFKIGNFKIDTPQLVVAALVTYFLYKMLAPSENTKEITWQEFSSSLLSKGLVDKLQVINNKDVKVYLNREAVQRAHPDSPAVNPNFFYTFSIGSVEAFERKLDEAQKELGIPTSQCIPVSYTSATSAFSALASFAPTVLSIVFMVWLLRRVSGGAGGGGGGGVFGMGKTKAKKYSHETAVQVKFKDVAGADEAKLEIMEFVSFLKDPGRFEKLGAKIPRGAILSGPPGTGKTLLAKATAGESGVPFFSCSGSEFVEIFVGVGPSRVRDLFAQARKNTPCIIFIDEIDAIGKSRSKASLGGGNDEREATLNQILTEMDGFSTTDQVVVLAGTNRPDVLDAALMRPGRFDRHITIDRPTLAGRKQIFGVYLPKIKTEENLEFLAGRLSSLTPGFSGADIANCVNEAALIAARVSADKVVMSHFEQAIERTVAGLEKKSLVLNPEEKKVVAYHEAGHAICGWFFKYADPLLKVSIIPRGQGALGYAMNVPGDTYLMNVNQMMDKMAMILGGRVSEELHFETVTSGASDDFNKVTRIATSMVTKFGMSEKIGYLFYDDDENKLHKPFSEETARNIDLEVRRIISEAYDQCKRLLTEKKKEVGIVAEELLRKEMLDRDDMIRLLGKRPWSDNKEFEKYFGQRPDAPPSGPSAEPNMLPLDPSGPLVLPPNTDTPGATALFKNLV